jgi:hypothetical protein
MTPLDKWLQGLAYTDFPEELLRTGTPAGSRPYAAEIEEILATDRGIGASAVFCVDNLPTICIIDATAFADDLSSRIEQIRQRVWNQNLASVVLVIDVEAASAYSVLNRAAEPDVLPYAHVNRYKRWSAYEVQSGFIKDRLSSWFDPDERVDRRLLKNLRDVVKLLVTDGLTATKAEALMAQVIFLCYLEHRGIIGDAYRKKHRLDFLVTYVSGFDGAGLDKLLARLGRDFNGDFLSSAEGGAPPWSNIKRKCFEHIGTFLEAVDLETGQESFWRYDFSRIPVELISGIYETLLKERQGTLGAYYTPRHLANLVVDQAFESFQAPESCTIYDGACGSGILLTTAFRRMLRYMEVKQSRPLRFLERIDLMQRAVFGNDVDETACWITAFSLYLSLLEGLDPSDISLLQSDENVKLPHLIGPSLNIQKGEKRGDFFSKDNPFAGSRRFDIFLCNPPWRESADDEEATWEEWCATQPVPYPIGRRQIASGFAYRATRSVREDGVIALVMPLNLITGATQQSTDFRRRWLEEVKIERIVNFADVRRLLFAAAIHPCAVVRVRPRPEGEIRIALANERIEYWTPKADVSLALGRLAVHAIDQKLVTASEVYDMPYALISRYWGDGRDLDLLRRLRRFGTLSATMKSRSSPWVSGKGFHAANRSNPDRELGKLGNLRYLAAARLPLAYPVISRDVQLPKVRDEFPIVASPGGKNGKLYEGPRVLFADGLTEGCVIRAVYSDQKFAFQSSVAAIGGAIQDADLIKFLTAYLRSPLATYLMVLTGYSVTSERPRVAVDDVEAFPFCGPEKHPKPKRASEIVKEVAQLLDSVANEPEWQRDHAYDRVQLSLFELVYEYFGIGRADQELVMETVKWIVPSIQPAHYDQLTTPLLGRPSREEVTLYASTLSEELSEWRELRGGSGSLTVSAILGDDSDFFGAVRITTDRDGSDATRIVHSADEFSKLLVELEQALHVAASGRSARELFRIPNLLVLAGNAFYLIKPMRRRFWLAKAAFSDADQVAQTIQTAAWSRARQ